MNKILFIGDIHTKENIVNKVDEILTKDKQIKKAIFVGDYVDEWSASEQEDLNILNSIFNLKKKYGDRVILLLGNHELSYMGYPCSGHIYPDDQIKKVLEENHSLLQVLYYNKDYIVSHGGITQNWLEVVKQFYKGNLKEIINQINIDFQDVNSERYKDLLQLLSMASVSSGSNSLCASCLWARPQDHRYSPLSEMVDQIVGHTPIFMGIEESREIGGLLRQNTIYYIDSFSTYKDRRPYGKQEALLKVGYSYMSVKL